MIWVLTVLTILNMLVSIATMLALQDLNCPFSSGDQQQLPPEYRR